MLPGVLVKTMAWRAGTADGLPSSTSPFSLGTSVEAEPPFSETFVSACPCMP